MYKQKVQEILSRELSRKEFLRAGGVLALGVLGLPALLDTLQKAFSSGNQKKLPPQRDLGSGYGDRPYGK
jgi:hypothetical protein